MTGGSGRPSVVVDVQALQNPEYRDRGIGRFVTETTRALLSLPDSPVAAIVANPLRPFPHDAHPELRPSVGFATASTFRRLDVARPVAWYITSPFEMHSPIESILPPYVVARGAPVVVQLYDLIPLREPGRYLTDPVTAGRYRARLEVVRSADLVLALSEHTRAEAIRLLGLPPERVKVTGAGVSPFFTPEPLEGGATAAVPPLGITRPFVLTVAGEAERKNTDHLISAYARLPSHVRDEVQLVVVCHAGGEWRGRWMGHAARAGLAPDSLVLTGFVDDETLRALYRNARLFVFPSLSEGFGLPLAEAVACGAPSISSSTTSVPEVLGMPESTFDPRDVDDMARRMEHALVDTGYRARLRAAGAAVAERHRWPAVASRIAGALSEMDVGSRRRGRTRLAVVDGPEDLVTALSQRCDLDVLTSGRSAPRRVASARWFPLNGLGRIVNPAAYDAIFHVATDESEAMAEVSAAMERYPVAPWHPLPQVDNADAVADELVAVAHGRR